MLNNKCCKKPLIVLFYYRVEWGYCNKLQVFHGLLTEGTTDCAQWKARAHDVSLPAPGPSLFRIRHARCAMLPLSEGASERFRKPRSCGSYGKGRGNAALDHNSIHPIFIANDKEQTGACRQGRQAQDKRLGMTDKDRASRQTDGPGVSGGAGGRQRFKASVVSDELKSGPGRRRSGRRNRIPRRIRGRRGGNEAVMTENSPV